MISALYSYAYYFVWTDCYYRGGPLPLCLFVRHPGRARKSQNELRDDIFFFFVCHLSDNAVAFSGILLHYDLMMSHAQYIKLNNNNTRTRKSHILIVFLSSAFHYWARSKKQAFALLSYIHI